jgi:hypothetical protein
MWTFATIIEVMREHTLLAREEDKARRMALKMILEGLPGDLISRITELDTDLIALMRKNNPN